MSLLCQSTERSINDLVDVSVGPMVMSYFVFVDSLHVKPKDLEELVDGLLYLDLKNLQHERMMRKARNESGLGSRR